MLREGDDTPVKTVSAGADSCQTSCATVSVIVPLYNKGKYVERAISSILCQTFPVLEIIVVDDGSTDAGPESVLRFSDPRIRLMKQENKGPGAARNAGLKIVRGKYVAFLDADDEWLPGFLEKGISLLEDKTADVTVIWTGYLLFSEMERGNHCEQELGGIYEIRPDTDISLVNCIMSRIWTCSAIMRTRVANKWGGFFAQYKCLLGEDKHLFMKLLFNERFGIIDEPLAIYHTEASDLWGNENDNMSTIEPFLVEPDAIINSCPLDTRHILREHLLFWALNRAEMYAKMGQKKKATELLDRFINSDYQYSKKCFKVQVLAKVAPILPFTRGLWRAVRPVRIPKTSRGPV